MIDRFLEEVRVEHQTRVPEPVLHEALREMRCHLEDARDAFLTTGKKNDEAEELAVKAFGDPSLAVPRRESIVEWRITRQSVGLMVFLAVVSSYVGLGIMIQIMDPVRFLNDVAQTLLATLCVAGIMAAPVVMAFRSRKVFATATAVALFTVFLLVDAPTQMGQRQWTLLTAPAPGRQYAYDQARAESIRSVAVLKAAEDYRAQLMAPGGEPNWTVVGGQTVFPTALTIAHEGGETKLYMTDQASRPYFDDPGVARVESLKRLETILPRLRMAAEDRSELDRAHYQAFADWTGNLWENSREYLKGAGICMAWALFAQLVGSVARRLSDRLRPHKRTQTG